MRKARPRGCKTTNFCLNVIGLMSFIFQQSSRLFIVIASCVERRALCFAYAQSAHTCVFHSYFVKLSVCNCVEAQLSPFFHIGTDVGYCFTLVQLHLATH